MCSHKYLIIYIRNSIGLLLYKLLAGCPLRPSRPYIVDILQGLIGSETCMTQMGLWVFSSNHF